MFGLGIWEIAVILLLALLVLGPQKLPTVARQLARGMREVRRAANEFQSTMEEAADAGDLREMQQSIRRELSEPPEGAQPREVVTTGKPKTEGSVSEDARSPKTDTAPDEPAPGPKET